MCGRTFTAFTTNFLLFNRMKLVSVEASPIKNKKYRATFDNGKHTDFGFKPMDDYTQHHDKDRRRLYLLRHRKDLKTGDPTRPGFLSMFLLWGESTDLKENIKTYKRLFDL